MKTKMKASMAPFEVRIKDGSYTVEATETPSGGEAGQQHIPTVTNTGAVSRVRVYLSGMYYSFCGFVFCLTAGHHLFLFQYNLYTYILL